MRYSKFFVRLSIFTLTIFYFVSCKVISRSQSHGITKKEKITQEKIAGSDEVLIGQSGTFEDERDGKTYKWVRVGDQIWMVQNLAYKADWGCSPFRWKKRMAEKEGYLYDWETAQKVPPKGWHLPSVDEYKRLIDYVGGTNPKNSFIFLVEKDSLKLNFKNNGEYWANFPKKGKGIYNGGTFHPVKRTKLWTSTYQLSFHKDTLYSNFGIRYTSKEAWLSFSGDKLDRYPIRCIKDSN